MSGKGSRRRPISKDYQSNFDAQWDLIFGGKNMKSNENKQISKHMSTNGKLEAIVIHTSEGYVVELFEQSRYIRTIDCSSHSIDWAENVAENYVLGIHIP